MLCLLPMRWLSRVGHAWNPHVLFTSLLRFWLRLIFFTSEKKRRKEVAVCPLPYRPVMARSKSKSTVTNSSGGRRRRGCVNRRGHGGRGEPLRLVRASERSHLLTKAWWRERSSPVMLMSGLLTRARPSCVPGLAEPRQGVNVAAG